METVTDSCAVRIPDDNSSQTEASSVDSTTKGCSRRRALCRVCVLITVVLLISALLALALLGYYHYQTVKLYQALERDYLNLDQRYTNLKANFKCYEDKYPKPVCPLTHTSIYGLLQTVCGRCDKVPTYVQ